MSFQLDKKQKVKEILETIDMTYEQFRDLCIMCGSDYNKNIFNLNFSY